MGENKENKEIPVLDFNECIDWIDSETEYDRDTIQRILEMETEWMKQAGVIIEGEPVES